MGYKETYNRWLTSDVVDDDTKQSLNLLKTTKKK